MMLFSSFHEGEERTWSEGRKDPKKALEMIRIGNMLTDAFFGIPMYSDPPRKLHVAEIKDLMLPWNEKGTHGKMTINKAYEIGDKQITRLCDAIVQIEMTCSGRDYSYARCRKATNKSRRVTSHKQIEEILQKYYDQCGGGKVCISGDGILSIR